jgi:transcription elongation factor Elf1
MTDYRPGNCMVCNKPGAFYILDVEKNKGILVCKNCYDKLKDGTWRLVDRKENEKQNEPTRDNP